MIQVHPPYWRSSYALIFYFFVILALSLLIWRNTKKKLIREQQAEFNRKEAERLKQLNEMKTRFFSNVTHEFRTPLTLILSPIEKHLRNTDLDKKTKSLLESNYKQGSHLLKLINQMLDISKIESKSMPTKKSIGNLSDYIKGIISSFSEMALQKNIVLNFGSKDLTEFYLFDKNQIKSVIVNLLSNAIKFTNQGKISLNLSLIEKTVDLDTIAIEIQDSGIGIQEKDLDKLFNRFYQVDDSLEREHEGTGIGLSLVKEIVELNNAKISCESIYGKGSCFKIEWPFEKVEQNRSLIDLEKNPILKTDNEVNKNNSAVILVVEDNKYLRKFIVESLSENWQTLESSNGQEAWEITEKNLPDLIVSDVMMPLMNGYDLCKKVKSDSRTSHINVLLLSAKSAQESKLEGLESGADDYLTKPFQSYELELRIQNLLKLQANYRTYLKARFLSDKAESSDDENSNPFLINLNAFLDLHIDDSQLSIDLIAAELNLSRSTLNRKLRVLLDISTNNYIKHYRLLKSLVLLKNGFSISEVTYRVGFESASYYSQCFKEQFNQNPSEYVKSLKHLK